MAITMNSQNFAAACLHVYQWTNGDTTREFYVCAFNNQLDGEWILFLDDINHPDHKVKDGERWNPKLISLASTRNPGESRHFMTLDALYNEAKRMAENAGATLNMTIRS
jgi:hypothetical protein